MSHLLRHIKPWHLYAVGIILIVVIGIAGISFRYSGQETQVCTVSNKYVVPTQEGHEKRIETYTCGVFTVQDDPFQGVWDSASTYGRLTAESEYTITSVGHRIPLMSMFPNIITATPTPNNR